MLLIDAFDELRWSCGIAEEPLATNRRGSPLNSWRQMSSASPGCWQHTCVQQQCKKERSVSPIDTMLWCVVLQRPDRAQLGCHIVSMRRARGPALRGLSVWIISTLASASATRNQAYNPLLFPSSAYFVKAINSCLSM